MDGAGSQVPAVQRDCGSVSFNADGSAFAVSAPRGGLVTYRSAAGEYLGRHEQADECGIASAGRGFYCSDGCGIVAQRDAARAELHRLRRDDTSWDNHLLALSL